ncbi:SpaA isopeptide-forming pilin-related protein [Enterococcus sp. N342-3-1-2]
MDKGKNYRMVSIGILLLQFLMSLFVLHPVYASSASVNVLDQDAVRIDAQSKLVEGDATQWEITYDIPEGAFWFQATADQSITFIENTGLEKKGEWFSSEETKSNQKGTLVMKTSNTVNQIDIQVKVIKTDPAQSEQTVTLYESSEPISIRAQIESEEQIETVTSHDIQSDQKERSEQTDPEMNDETMESQLSKYGDDRSSDEPPNQNVEETIKNDAEYSENTTIKARALEIIPASLTDSADPFKYDTTAEGTFPNQHTNSYLNNNSSSYIQNYNFEKNITEQDSTTTNAYGGNQTFENGYHEYEDAYIKKIVLPTEDPNQFNIQLDVIGKALKTSQPVDIALVIDKSASMRETLENNKSRWQIMKEAVNDFADNLLTTENNDLVRIGITSFGSANNGSQNIPYAEIQKFSGGSAFTSNKSSLTNSSIISAGNAPENSGTPTFLGIDAGYAMLTSTKYQARSNAVKVLIVLTDGDPTFAPNDGYNQLANNILSLTNTSTSMVDTYNARINNTNYFSGNGTTSAIASSATATISHMNKRFAENNTKNVITYSIGYTTGSNDVLKKIGKDGAYQANNKNELLTVLGRISSSFSASVQNATINDPMSDYVKLIPNSAKITAMYMTDTNLVTIDASSTNFPDYAKQVSLDQATAKLTVSNLYLSEKDNLNQGIRLTYTVELKEAYRDGLFYQTNQNTYLLNRQSTTSTSEYLHFAIPSIRTEVTTRSFKVRKIWQDQDNQYRLRKDIVIQLQEKAGNEWKDVNGKKVLLSATASNAELITTFSNLPKYKNGQLITYRLVEKIGDQNRVDGYEMPSYSISETIDTTTQLEVTNTLLTKSISLTKVTEEDRPLSGASFDLYVESRPNDPIQSQISDGNGKLTFKDLPIGNYIIKEKSAPNGYQKMADLYVEIIDKDGSLSIIGLPENAKLVNQRYPFEINLKKMNADLSTPLQGAIFALSGDGIDTIQATSDDNGQLTFSTQVPTGVYQIKEITAPQGYQQLEGFWQVHILDETESYVLSPEGKKIKLSSTFDEEKSAFILKEITVVNDLNDFHLKVTKVDQTGQPLAGATFRLTNHDDIDLTMDSSSESTFHFKGLRSGTYELTETKTPSGFQGLKVPIMITIAEDGKVMVNDQITSVELSSTENLILLSVSNHAIPTLPQTGGKGVTPFIVCGTLLIVGTIAPWIYLKRRWRA